MQAEATLYCRVAPLPTRHSATPALVSTSLGRGEVGEEFSGHPLWTRHLTYTSMLQSQKNTLKDEP